MHAFAQTQKSTQTPAATSSLHGRPKNIRPRAGCEQEADRTAERIMDEAASGGSGTSLEKMGR